MWETLSLQDMENRSVVHSVECILDIKVYYHRQGRPLSALFC